MATTKAPDNRQRYDKLREEIERADRAYYVDADPFLTDPEYDDKLEQLRSLEHELGIDDPTSPTRRVGGEPVEGFPTRKHAVPMLSIDNSYSENDIKDWIDRTARALKKPRNATPKDERSLFDENDDLDVKLVCDAKIDGVAVSLRYEDGSLALALTRGNGTEGDDITEHARHIRAIPLNLHTEQPPPVIEVRGEIYIPNKAFIEINQHREHNGQEPFMNPRNACAGTLKSLDTSIVAQRKLAFSGHGRGQIDGIDIHDHQTLTHTLRALGVPMNTLTPANSIADVMHAIDAIQQQSANAPYATDGVVIRVNDYRHQQRLGATSKAPRWCIAYKFPAERKPTRLLRIQTQVGKTGKVTPRAVMEPVVLAGTVVQHASLHNFGLLAEKDIREGDTVLVEKAGEIIPQVIEVTNPESKEHTSLNKYQPPTKCPECKKQLELERDDEGRETARRCTNPECPAQIREKIIHFAGRRQMDIDGLAEKTIDQIRATNLPKNHPQRAELGVPADAAPIPLDHFADIFRLHQHRDSLLALDRMAQRKVDNILNGIERAKTRGLARVLAGMGIRHVGETTAKALARNFKDLDQLLDASLPRLMPTAYNTMSETKRREFLAHHSIEPDDNNLSTIEPAYETNLGKDTAPVVHRYLHSDAAQQTFRSLRDLGVDLTSHDYTPPHQQKPTASHVAGKTIVLTGTLDSLTRDEARDQLEALGAKVTSSISSKTDILVAGNDPGSKQEKAQQLGTTIWSEKQLLDALKS